LSRGRIGLPRYFLDLLLSQSRDQLRLRAQLPADQILHTYTVNYQRRSQAG